MRRNTVRSAALLGSLVLCLTAVACSGESATEQKSGGGGGGGDGKVTISHWQHQSDARAKLVEGFVDSYDDANIDFQSIPYESYFQKLGAALEAGNGPCVFQLPANILQEFYGRGELAPVPDSIMSAADIESAFTPASIRLLKIEGQYYALPTDVQTMMLFYNDDLFKEAGLDPTQDFATWDDLVEAAKKLTKTSGDKMTQAGMDLSASPYQLFYAAPTLAYPDGLVNDQTGDVQYDSEPGQQAWERITSLITEDHVDDPEFLAEQSKFGLGKAGMTFKEFTFDGVYKLTAPDVHFSVHPAPPVTDDAAAPVASTSWSYAVSADCDDKDAAWKWVAYLTSEDAQRKWIEGGGELPSRTALLTDESLQDDPNVAAGFAALAEAEPYDSNGWDDAYAVQQKIWDEIVLNGTDVATAVEQGADAERDLYRSKGLLE
ncbi:extracellular solute-binding protein [Nocardioides anomalus]|uniref:Extracellular solute-binding protein n=1 Tax=Nocardioides anomalus TaxID=2712223 RepID=A0A6G6WDZ9_9ACTN|nr:extracellular solute-binding protein [Nocardioides anomalus]QIG43377.1 extracellular solute-binding protein [Nocardioides anomalus]